MKIGDKRKVYCSECHKYTNHIVVALKKIKGIDYDADRYYTIVECNGCDCVSYMTEDIDYEQVGYDENGQPYPDITQYFYPEILENHKRLEDIYHLPPKIGVVYKEAIKAFTSKCYLLAAIAFRTIIEAVCIDKSITIRSVDGDDLGAKINKLVKNGFITQREAERLHAIRFKGNDSVHEMIVPKPQELFIVLDTIEHLLKNLYLIDKQFDRNLGDTIIKDFQDFRYLLSDHLSKLTIGESLPLGKILGKSARRLSTRAKDLEKELQEKIKNGEYKYLELGDIKPHQDPKKENIQFYIIKDLQFDWDDLGL